MPDPIAVRMDADAQHDLVDRLAMVSAAFDGDPDEMILIDAAKDLLKRMGVNADSMAAMKVISRARQAIASRAKTIMIKLGRNQ